MKITDLMIQETMIMDLQATTKDGAIDELIASLNRSGRINDPALFKEMIYKEKQSPVLALAAVLLCHMPKPKRSMNQRSYLQKQTGCGL